MSEPPVLPLADLSAIPPAPGWFTDALARPWRSLTVDCGGIPIETRSWGDPAKPGLVFIHGNAAHLGWWSFLAPLFTDDFHVVTYSIGGMGLSGWRDHYTVGGFADELWAVIDATGMGAHAVPPVVVAHSMGGLPVIHASATSERPLRAVILVDVALPGEEMIDVPAYPGHRLYPTLEAALGRFRLSPAQGCANGWIAEYLGRMSVGEVTGPDGEPRWTWRFDPRLWGDVEFGDIWGDLARMRAPVAIVRGALSRLSGGSMDERMVATAPPGPHIVVPEADHHIMIDQPIAMIAVLRTLLAAWVK